MAPEHPHPPLICFDLGGVVVRICRSWDEGCQAAGIPVRAPERREATRALRQQVILGYQTGRLTCDDFAERVSAILDGVYTPREIMAVHAAWILGEYPGMKALIDEIHERGLDTGVLSNTNHAHWMQLSSMPAFTSLRNRHASHLLRLHKPDPAIYRAFEEAVNRPAHEILFFDDLPENVDAARAAGWRAEPIDPAGDSAAQVRRVLMDLELL